MIIVTTQTGSFNTCLGFLIVNEDGDIYFLQTQDDDIDWMNNANFDIYIQKV